MWSYLRRWDYVITIPRANGPYREGEMVTHVCPWAQEGGAVEPARFRMVLQCPLHGHCPRDLGCVLVDKH